MLAAHSKAFLSNAVMAKFQAPVGTMNSRSVLDENSFHRSCGERGFLKHAVLQVADRQRIMLGSFPSLLVG